MGNSNNNGSKLYIPTIDGLRGIAALMVCIFHLVCFRKVYISDELLIHKICRLGNFGVDIFFVISGIVIPLSLINAQYTLKEWTKFMSKRIIRIEPPYLIAMFIAAFIIVARAYLLGQDWTSIISPTRILLHIGYLIPLFPQYTWISDVYWTLCAEFQFYLFLSVTIFFLVSSEKIKRYVFYVICLSLPVLTLLFADTLGFPRLIPLEKSPFIAGWLSLFLLGMIYVSWKTHKINTWEYAIVTLMASIVTITCLGYLPFLFGISTIVVVYFFPHINTKVSRFLGNISYSLYLLHLPIGTPIVDFLSHRLIQPYQKVIAILLAVGILLVLSYLFYLLVEKPSKELAARISYKKS